VHCLSLRTRDFFRNEAKSHGPYALADDKIALPMTDLASGVDILGSFVDGEAILDCISRSPLHRRAKAFRFILQAAEMPAAEQAVS
jgi:hypothetical protein